MTIIQQNMLLALYERRYLPVAQFVMAKAGEPDVQMTALAPVYMGSKEDTMDEVKAMGAQLQELEDAGLLSLDYDIGLEGYPYTEYTESDLFAYFQQTVKEAQDRPDLFVFDTAKLELGSMELTIEGVLAVRAMLPEE